MPSQLLKQAFHVDNHPIVKNVVLFALDFEVFRAVLLQLSLDVLLDLFAALVLGRLVDLEDRVDRFLDRLLVTFLTDSNDLADDDVLEAILEQISSGPVLLDLLLGYDLLLSALLELVDLIVRHFEAFRAGELTFKIGYFLSELVLAAS